MAKRQVDDYEVAELFCHILGIESTEDDSQMAILEERLAERYGVDLDMLADIVSDLLPFCAEGRSALTGNRYRGFAADGAFIVKQEVVP